ncbi:hypothetical protein [Roseomonas sp. 18066]|uniref:hypothetical protein n=1 Tax=Roseomonas sp. 18066 TaxID=2681412 RepID=UPI001356A28A|nr:hypothetical protein [Roseomonas sp. 18066]
MNRPRLIRRHLILGLMALAAPALLPAAAPRAAEPVPAPAVPMEGFAAAIIARQLGLLPGVPAPAPHPGTPGREADSLLGQRPAAPMAAPADAAPVSARGGMR